jgi:hypothetical protein
MCAKIQEVYLSSDYQSTLFVPPQTDSTDVIVHLQNGEKYIASFFTYAFFSQWKLNQKDAKEELYGKYFWAPNMLVVDDCKKENIIKIVQHLIDEGDFRFVFKKLISG